MGVADLVFHHQIEIAVAIHSNLLKARIASGIGEMKSILAGPARRRVAILSATERPVIIEVSRREKDDLIEEALRTSVTFLFATA